MPSLVVTINKTEEIRVNVPVASSRGLHIAWMETDEDGDEGYFAFNIGGFDDGERIRWEVPNLHVGDEVTIKIIQEPVVDTATVRT